VFRDIGMPEGEADALYHSGNVLRARARTTAAIGDLAAAAERFAQLRHPSLAPALADLARALTDSNANRPARLALARADRAWAPGHQRRTQRVRSRALRARLALGRGDLRMASVYAARARHHSVRATGHGARIVAHRIAAEIALRRGDLHGARRDAETALAFARENGALFEAAAAGSGPAFDEINNALQTGLLAGHSPAESLRQLGHDLGIEDLVDLGSTIGLAETEGAPVSETIAAKARSIRERLVADIERAAATATERMTIPGAMLMIGFLWLISFPALFLIFQAR
jgi:hypothetical protein